MSRWGRFALGCSVILVAAAALAASPEPGPAKTKEKSFRFLGLQPEGGYLGIVIKDLDGPSAHGARVDSVRDESPAAKAGFEEGDIVVRFDGETVRSAEQLRRLVRETPPGREVSITVTRKGAEQKLTATLDKGRGDMAFAMGGPDGRPGDWPFAAPPMPPEAPLPPGAAPFDHDDGNRTVRRMHREFGPPWLIAPRGPRKLGIQFQEISGQLAKYFKVEGDEGILVVSVDEDGPAGKAGLKAGDVITHIAGKSVRDSEDVRREVDALDPGKEAVVTVERDGRSLDLKVTVGGAKPHPDAASTT
jgi:serine protease Do